MRQHHKYRRGSCSVNGTGDIRVTLDNDCDVDLKDWARFQTIFFVRALVTD